MSTPAPVTVIVPCFNEEEGLRSLVARLTTLQCNGGRGWQVLLVDDGSTDHTFARLLDFVSGKPWINVFRHPTNLGLGAALRTGIAHARAPIICTMDSDCTYPPERLPELVALLDDSVDIATASAWHPESDSPTASWVRTTLSRTVSELYKFFLKQDVYTFTCLFRAYRRDVLERIRFRSNGFAAVAEIMLRSLLAGYSVRELPMRLEARHFGKSKLKVGDAILAHSMLLTLTATLMSMRRVSTLLSSHNSHSRSSSETPRERRRMRARMR